MPTTNNSVIEKSNKILDALIKFDKEDPSKITMQQILDEIFDNKNKSPDTTQPSFVSDATRSPTKGKEIV